MKETVRVALFGDFSKLRKDWETIRPWPFDHMGTGRLISPSPDLTLLRELQLTHPEVRVRQFVERSYSTREMMAFSHFTVWVHSYSDDGGSDGFEFVNPCPLCGFPERRRRVQPLNLSKRPKKDLVLTDDWELVVSPRVATGWKERGLTGATLSSVLVDGNDSGFQLMTVIGAVNAPLADTLGYDGKQCNLCGRFDGIYATHASKELSMPAHVTPVCDLAYLNPSWERAYNHFKIMSSEAYRLLVTLKATGWWAQPIHVEPVNT